MHYGVQKAASQDPCVAEGVNSAPLVQRAETAGFPICQPPFWLASQTVLSQTSSLALPARAEALNAEEVSC